MRHKGPSDGTDGFALKDGDELVSVFTYPDTHAGDAIARRPSPRGGGTPPRLYSRHGFKPIARVQWDDAYTDPHWNHTRLGLPDTVAIDAPAHASPRVRDA